MTVDDRPPLAGVGGRLEAICGPGFARPAGGADEVAGRPARWVALPGSPGAVGEVLRLAAEYDLAVVPRGAGTKIDWGVPPARLDILLDTGRLAGVWHRSTGELTAEIGAGTPVRAVQAVLARSDQRLPIDVRSDGATVGGVVAADEAGPLRHRHGSPGSLLTEVSYVDATGRLVRAGVPGRDGVDRDPGALLCGSQGALGVLVSATLRVQTLPASRLWISRPVRTPLEMDRLVGEVVAGGFGPAAVEVDLPAVAPGVGDRPGPAERAGHPAGTGRRRPSWTTAAAGTLTVLIEGGFAEVAERARRLGRLLGPAAHSATDPPSWWHRYPFGPDDAVPHRLAYDEGLGVDSAGRALRLADHHP